MAKEARTTSEAQAKKGLFKNKFGIINKSISRCVHDPSKRLTWAEMKL